MRMINAKFIAGMLAMALVFGMIGCDQGTTTETKTVYVPTGGNTGPGGVDTGTYEAVRKERDLLAALDKDNVTVYVLADVTLSQSRTLKNGQNIVVGGDSGSHPYVKSEGRLGDGPLFVKATEGVTPKLNIGAKLTLESGSSLTVAGDGATVTVQADTTNPSKLTDMLHVQSGAKVGVGVSFVNSTAAAGASLNVNPFANVRFDEGAILAVAAEAGAVTLADKDSGIELRPGSKLAVVAEDGQTTSPDPIGSASSTGSVIVIPDGAAASIGITEVYKDVEVRTKDEELGAKLAVAKESINDKSTTPTVSDAAKVAAAFSNGATKVTYTGTAALGTVNVPANAKLIITGAVAAGTGDTATKITLASNGAALEIAEGASIDFGADGTLSGVTGSTVTNNGTIKTVTGNATQLQTFLVEAKGKIESSGEVSLTNATTIKSGTELTNSGTITVTSGATLTVADGATIVVADKGILDLTALYVADVSGGSTAAGDLNGVATINGTIEVASGGTYKSPAPSLAEEVVYEGTGKLKLNAGSTAYIGDIPYIGAKDATAALTWTDATPTGGYVIIDDEGMTLGGNGKLSHLPITSGPYEVLSSFQIAGKVTIDAGSVLTIGPTTGAIPDASVKVDSDDELVLNGTVELYTTGYLTVKNGGKLTVGNTGTIKHTGNSGNVKVSVHNGDWAPQKADVTENTTGDWTVALATSDGTAVNITLGTVKIGFTNAPVNVNLEDATPAAAGKLTAGNDTQIMFLGIN